MEKTEALGIWKKYYGESEIAFDYLAQPVKRDDFEDENSLYAWTVDAINPLGSPRDFDNLLPCSVSTKRLRSGRSNFKAGNHLFFVKKTGFKTFSLYDDNSKVAVENLKQDIDFQEARRKELYGQNRGNALPIPSLDSIRKSMFDDINVAAKKNDEDYKEMLLNEIDIADEIAKQEESETDLTALNASEIAEEQPDDTECHLTAEAEISADENQSIEEEKSAAEEITIEENLPVVEELEKDEAKAEEIEKLREEIQQLNEDLTDSDKRIQQLQMEKEELLEKISAFEEKSVESEEKMSIQRQEFENLQALLLTKDDEISSSHTERGTLNQKISDFEAQIANLEKVRADLEYQVANSAEKEKELLLAIEELTQENEEQKKQIEEAEKSEQRLLDEQNDSFKRCEEKAKFLEEESAELKNKVAELTKDRELLKSQEIMLASQTDNLRIENSDCEKKIVKLNDEIERLTSELEAKNFEVSKTREALQKITEEKKNDSSSFESEKRALTSDKEALLDKTIKLNIEIADQKKKEEEQLGRITELESEIISLNESLANFKEESERERALNEDRDSAKNREIAYLKAFGDPDKYQEFLTKYEGEKDISSYQSLLKEDRQFQRKEEYEIEEVKEDSYQLISNEDISISTVDVDREKAFTYWDEKIGESKEEFIDFAGRLIKKQEFDNKESEFSWGYTLFKKDDREYLSNILLAHTKSLADYSQEGDFTTNGHSFHVILDGETYKLACDDFITDPFNLRDVIRISRNNLEKKKKLIYIFVKPTSKTTAPLADKDYALFFDVIDRTAKRVCPSCFIEMKVVSQAKKHYCFLTFDGTKEAAYSRVLTYAIMLNSYRVNLKNSNGIDAYIVLNETQVLSKDLHLDFGDLMLATKDCELKAIYETLCTNDVCDSEIERSLHIGPSIKENLPVDESSYKPSKLVGKWFKQIYTFDKDFVTYNVIYKIG